MTVHPRDLQSDDLSRLYEDMDRVAKALARLTAAHPGNQFDVDATELPEINPDAVRREIRVRRLRARYFPEDLFAEPAWDILLDLFQARLMNRRVCISSACSAAAVPATTALRWVTSMVSQGLLERRADQLDGRRYFVELSDAMDKAMRLYFLEISEPGKAL